MTREAFWDVARASDGAALPGLPVRAVADDAGLVAVASGTLAAVEGALATLSTLAPGGAAAALAEAFARLPDGAEVVALLFRAGGAALAQRGQHRALALRDGRLLTLTSEQSACESLAVVREGLRLEPTADLAAAAASRAALPAEALGFLRAVAARATEVRALEAAPGTRYLVLSHTACRALGHDVLWQLAEARCGARAVVEAARRANPAQRRGMGAAVVQV